MCIMITLVINSVISKNILTNYGVDTMFMAFGLGST